MAAALVRWPCVDCKTPASSNGVLRRCPACSAARRKARRPASARQDERNAARRRQQREQARRERMAARRAEQAARVAAMPVALDAIALYRAEKAKKAHRDEAMLADARRLFLVLEEGMKPKRGRPKKSLSPLDTRAAA